MKRIALAFLILLVYVPFAYSGQGMGPGPGLGVPGAASVLPCDTYSPSEFCEDFEGSSLCDTGHASTCRLLGEWDDAVDPGDLDFDDTTDFGTNGCDDKGTYWVRIFNTNFSGSEYITLNMDAPASHYASFVIRIDKITQGITTNGEYISVAHTYDATGDTGFVWALLVINVSGTFHWVLYDGESTNTIQSSSSLVDGNNYKVQIKWVNGAQELKVGALGAATVSVATGTETITRAPTTINFGGENALNNGFSGDYEVMYDNILIDDTAYPTSCDD